MLHMMYIFFIRLFGVVRQVAYCSSRVISDNDNVSKPFAILPPPQFSSSAPRGTHAMGQQSIDVPTSRTLWLGAELSACIAKFAILAKSDSALAMWERQLRQSVKTDLSSAICRGKIGHA